MSTRSLSRRSLIGAAASSVALLGVASGQTAPQVPDDPTKVQGRPPSDLGDRSPFEAPRRTPAVTTSQTPLDLLNGIITPSDLHYERHHAGVPAIDPARYSLTIHGMVDRPTVYTLGDLQRFPSLSRIMFLECSGNSGAGWTKGPPTGTAQTLHGLTSTSDWTGVLVSTLLNEVGVQPGARWVLAEGEDAAVLSRSVPIEKMRDDAFIAYGQNGEALRPEQGYPARLMLPGWEGNINVKWLRRLKFGDRPFETREETSKYTDPMPDGSARQFTFVMEAKSTIGQRIADKVASFGGSWTFIIIYLSFLIAWMAFNTFVLVRYGHGEEGAQFDAYPYILLNLMLSMTAALQAPIIMMSQNRAAEKDRLAAEQDFKVNLKSELMLEELIRKQRERDAQMDHLNNALQTLRGAIESHEA